MKRLLLAMLLGSTAAIGTAWPADSVLVDFRKGLEGVKFKATEATAEPFSSAGKAGLRVGTQPSKAWPGITVSAPNGTWDLTPFAEVAAELVNPGTNPVTVCCRVDNVGADGTRNCVTRALTLSPGATETLRVPLTRARDDRMDGKLFGMRGYPVRTGGNETVDPAKINQFLLFVSSPPVPHEFSVVDVRATGTYTPPTAWTSDADPFFPFIDAFGQYRHKEWPGKVRSVSDLKTRRDEEVEALARRSGPNGWDKYGGWADGPSLPSTGFFRTQKVDRKWWLVDPEGKLFFSHGIDCVMMLDTTPIDDRELWFDDFPGASEPFKAFASQGYALLGHYANKRPRCFSFAGANLFRKYGPDWRKEYAPVIHKRLRSWGLNTIANWSDESLRLQRQTAYTDTIGSGRTRNIEGSEGYWGKFPDVFDPSFAQNLRAAMDAKRDTSAGDPGASAISATTRCPGAMNCRWPLPPSNRRRISRQNRRSLAT